MTDKSVTIYAHTVEAKEEAKKTLKTLASGSKPDSFSQDVWDAIVELFAND